MTDLYFYDLPGIIANVRTGGNASDIKLVTRLAETYISKPSCIILLAISCETDFENQGGGRLVLKNNDMKRRTIGVLTKPDRCEPGNEYRWTAILKGQETPLDNGWFCVKQPDSLQLRAGISWEDARASEAEFFNHTDPWKAIQGSLRNRLGSEALTKHLSILLSNLVSQRLPFIREEISNQLHNVETELLTIPAPNLLDPCSDVHQKIMAFTRDVSAHVKGIPEFGPQVGLMEGLLRIYEKFREDIQQTAPRFRPWIKKKSKIAESELLKLTEQGDEAHGQILYLNEVVTRARRARTRELPGNHPFVVKEHLIQGSWKMWESFVIGHFKEVQDLVRGHITKLVEKHFNACTHGGLLQAVMSIIETQLLERSRIAAEKLNGVFRIESLPFTQNEDYFFEEKEKLITRYRSIYALSQGENSLFAKLQVAVLANNPLNPDKDIQVSSSLKPARSPEAYIEPFEKRVTTALSSLAALGLEGLTRADLLRLIPPDHTDPAIDIMAEVRAYWQVAFKRFSDVVPLEIDHEYLLAFDAVIHLALVEGLGLTKDGARNACARWLQEDPNVVARREELQGKQRMLEAARDSLITIRSG
jgi:hypothetical protein